MGKPGAAAAVARGGKIIHSGIRGLANLQSARAIEQNTIFRIGSLTKQFTAVAILMLEERCKLLIDASIRDYLPDVPRDYDAISLRHLLTHTAGIPNYTGIPGYWSKHSGRDVTLEEACAYFMELPLEFCPGERFQYSNSGYVLLGRLIEAVAGKSYGNFLLDEFFRPLGMSDTCYLNSEQIAQHRAVGYIRTKDGFQNAPYLSMTWPHASGALGSTVIDLIKWQTALAGGKVIKRETLDLMHRPATLTDRSATAYGMGWMIGVRDGKQYVYHSGSIKGFASHMAWFSEQELTVVVLSNLQSFPAVQFGNEVAQAALAV